MRQPLDTLPNAAPPDEIDVAREEPTTALEDPTDPEPPREEPTPAVIIRDPSREEPTGLAEAPTRPYQQRLYDEPANITAEKRDPMFLPTVLFVVVVVACCVAFVIMKQRPKANVVDPSLERAPSAASAR